MQGAQGSKGLYALKPWYTRRLDGAIRLAQRRGLSPDVFTVLGVLSALLAGGAIAAGWWPAALLLLAGRLAGANLDGAVARARGVSRPWGFVLNEAGDRVSDLLMFAGLAVLAVREPATVLVSGSLTSVVWVLVATTAATLPTLVSLSGAGAGSTRLNGGPFGKTERCAVVVLATAVPAWIPVVALLVVAGSVATAVARLRRVHAELSAARSR
ncbi:CDP-alcohol phosphatidyltransferase family protein [Pengzhenrongella frigida]|uniref:CDP-alcohol phosphatidyltransferase family protein n=1 Tax=Pengzhenrongella frigida TaxID=1259133 RepID=A0A4Q5MYY5_9MICO|nr:CDP-alcohol phosphatidyltransferase family protein [Cellulomonas sp. HLT2-17]RYV50910.1 CDP-alcohol phosphatidyltransferase family protein [Cellulomonas sp. HLT2-17]